MKWQPISTAPKDGTDVLLVYPPDGKSVLFPKYGVGRYTGDLLWDWGWEYKPKYWQPLPPPEEET